MRSAWFSPIRGCGSRRHGLPMQSPGGRPRPRLRGRSAAVVGTPLVAVVLVGTALASPAWAAQTVQLGTATPFAVLAGTAVTDVPTSSITGDVGLSPAAGTNYAGLTQAEVTGSIYSTDGTGPAGNVNDPALLTTAKNDLTTAYVAAAGQSPTSTFAAGDNQLGGKTLTAGVYAFGHAATANITAASPLVLNGQGDANSVFVFQASSDLVTASGSAVELVNGARACNVFWQVSSSATLNSSTTFVGTIMALTSDTLGSGATVEGRVLARNGAVTLDANTITAPPACAVVPPPTTTTTGATTTATTTTATTTAGTGGTGGSTGSTGSTGTAATSGSTGTGTTGSAVSTSAVVPAGAPHTGFGGAARYRNDWLIAFGVLALVAAPGALVVARRRSDQHHGESPPASP